MIENLRIVLDTNALISILSRKLNFQKILILLKDGKFDLFFTTEILLEYEEKLAQFYGEKQSNNLFYLLDILTNVHKIETYYNLDLISVDKTDNKFIDCAFSCNAHYIVTNDKHFNILKTIEYPKIEVISIEKFAELINN